MMYPHIEGEKSQLSLNRPTRELGTSPKRVSASTVLSALSSFFSSLRSNESKQKDPLEEGCPSDPTLQEETRPFDSPEDQELEINLSYLTHSGPIKVAKTLSEGMPLLKVSHKSKKRIQLSFDIDSFAFKWKNINLASVSTPGKIQRFVESQKNKIHEFSVDEIRTVAMQNEASNYREELQVSKDSERVWITIIYIKKNGKVKSLNLIADSEHDFRKLSNTVLGLLMLRDLLSKNFFINLNDMDRVQRDILFQDTEGPKEARQVLNFEDVLKYARRLQVNMTESYLRDKFDMIIDSEEDSKIQGGLNFSQFKKFVSELKRRKDIELIWYNLCEGNKMMSFQRFESFMNNIQNEKHPQEYLKRIFSKFCIDDTYHWVPENFNNFLLSRHCLSQKSVDEEDVFKHPLNEYFISSSHNTYLMGRQFAGESSVEGYIRALQRGCRCVEIDIWDKVDGNLNNEPVVCHGRSFTSAISFVNVARTIKKHAFVSSRLPLIISLEVHCCKENQLIIKQILETELGDLLVKSPLVKESSLPSPWDLRKKILVKVKRTSPFSQDDYFEHGLSSTVSTVSTSSNASSMSTNSSNPSHSEDNSSAYLPFKFKTKKRGTIILEELSVIGIYLQGLKFKNFSLPESKTYNHCFSLGESSLNGMFRDETKSLAVDKHNRKYMMRVYPSKFRLLSSNFNPVPYWQHGVQMVATNWQTYDSGQQINEAMFESPSHYKGFVLKPPYLRKLSKSSKRLPELISWKRYRFEIEIISAHQLPRPKGSTNVVNPFVNFEVIGASDLIWNNDSRTSTTKIVSENGFNPIWLDHFGGTFTTSTDLVFFRFTVNTSSSCKEPNEIKLICLQVVRFCNLKQGYRYLPLNDPFGEALLSTSLFLRYQLSQAS